jgi:hypothetical protein
LRATVLLPKIGVRVAAGVTIRGQRLGLLEGGGGTTIVKYVVIA